MGIRNRRNCKHGKNKQTRPAPVWSPSIMTKKLLFAYGLKLSNLNRCPSHLPPDTAAANTVSKTKDRAATRRFQKSKKQAQRSSNWEKDKRSLPWLVSHLLHSASSALANHVKNAQKDTRRRDWKQETPKKIAKQNCYSNFSVLTYKVCPFHLLRCGCFSDSWVRRREAWSFCFL